MRTPRLLALVLAALSLAPALRAGGSGENALLVVDPRSREARYLANVYQAARDVPERNVLYLEAGAATYAELVAGNLAGFQGALEERGIADHVDYVIVMPGADFFVAAPGLIADGCWPVNRLSIGSAYGLANQAQAILGGLPVSRPNRYFSPDGSVVAFDSGVGWLAGQPDPSSDARYYIGAMLGYLGPGGNTVEEVVALVQRSAAADGTHPVGTSYFMQTGDWARSSPRHGAYPAVAAAIVALGGSAQHLFADLPLGQHDALGIMTGLASPDVLGADLTLLPGAFADHLTSYAGAFDVAAQTKMSDWISKGASGTSGAVEEPCNYPGKFPHARLHLFYRQGLSLGEAWLRSMEYLPFQSLLYGDPLTRPFAYPPVVDVPDAPGGAPLSDTVLLHPTAVATAPGAAVERVELWVDGVVVRAGAAGEALPLPVATLDDGWHELRVLAYDDTDARHVGRWIGSFQVDRAGRAASLSVGTPSGDLGTPFDFVAQATGADLVELRLVSSGRVVAATSSAQAAFGMYGQILGAGPARVQAEALYGDGSRVRSAPVEVQVAFTGGYTTPIPEVFSFTKTVPVGVPTVVEMPANYDYDPIDVGYPVTVPPQQATLAVDTGSASLVVIPDPGASGTDSFRWRAETQFGMTVEATVHLVYEPPAGDCPAPAPYCTPTPNSTGTGAFLGWSGSTSVLANDLVLSAFGAVPGQPGVFFHGPTQVQVPFGDGTRCVGAGSVGLFRWSPAVVPDAFGDVVLPVDLNSPALATGPGAWLPGTSWNVQLWYRDPAAGGAGFNLSSALHVELCP